MKLNPLQRWAIKIGIPRSVLNGFAQEYYGYAIPDADGKYPDWWYKEQNIPPTVRDCEVPKEVLKHESGSKNGATLAPKTYVRVKHGKIVEIVAKETATQSVPHFSSHHRNPVGQYPHTSYPQRRHEALHTDEHRDFPVETDEIIYRVADTRGRRFDEVPRLSRTISTPVFPAATDNDDIMSLIREDALPRSRQPTVHRDVLDPTPPVRDTSYPGGAFPHPHRSSTVPNPRPNAYFHRQSPPTTPTIRRGPSLPTSPRPTVHRRTETTATDNTIFGYYTSPAANSTAPVQTAYSQGGRRRSYRPLEEVEEDEMSEWSGYASETEGAWEDEEEPFGRTQAFRQAAGENLRSYRQGR
jgi:hypothetical protein